MSENTNKVEVEATVDGKQVEAETREVKHGRVKETGPKKDGVLKKLFINPAKKAFVWMKDHPWQTVGGIATAAAAIAGGKALYDLGYGNGAADAKAEQPETQALLEAPEVDPEAEELESLETEMTEETETL